MELNGKYKSRSDFGKQTVTMTRLLRVDTVDLTIWRHVMNREGKDELVSCHKFSLTHDCSGKNKLTGEILMEEAFNETRGEKMMLKSCSVIIRNPPLDSILIQVKEFRCLDYETLLKEEGADLDTFNTFAPTSSQLLKTVSEFEVSPLKTQMKMTITDKTNNNVDEMFFDRVDEIYRRPAPTSDEQDQAKKYYEEYNIYKQLSNKDDDETCIEGCE